MRLRPSERVQLAPALLARCQMRVKQRACAGIEPSVDGVLEQVGRML